MVIYAILYDYLIDIKRLNISSNRNVKSETFFHFYNSAFIVALENSLSQKHGIRLNILIIPDIFDIT